MSESIQGIIDFSLQFFDQSAEYKQCIVCYSLSELCHRNIINTNSMQCISKWFIHYAFEKGIPTLPL